MCFVIKQPKVTTGLVHHGVFTKQVTLIATPVKGLNEIKGKPNILSVWHI